MESLGSYLKRERELREITLDEIAREIKVKQKFLEAIEEEDFDSLPAPAFLKGFLRAYARYIGLDDNDVVLRYEYLFENLKEDNEKKEVTNEKITIPSGYKLIILILLLGLGLVFLLVYLYIL